MAPASTGVLHAAIVTAPIDVSHLIGTAQAAGVGALSVFLGTVRDLNDGRPVQGMDYEAYEAMAASELAAVAREVCDRTPGLRVAIEHRIGTLGIGEVSVAIVAAHAHRGPAMDGAREIIESLKQRVPIWKREHYVDGERAWVDPTRAGQVPLEVPR
ncbi:molybdenum cofactor biosynthesis protein MoaE [Gemmatimonas phototrophica]|uniref:molybdenum cofactor biosynthesis protein MoaE n=1 Tax=Gemmatimonas phototrophica TaxID=1379270 RepID=UPI000A4C7608|nr:molybdenum cofactor biosynthesis protein MoaE [Gemmatimonas phototrophica]